MENLRVSLVEVVTFWVSGEWNDSRGGCKRYPLTWKSVFKYTSPCVVWKHYEYKQNDYQKIDIIT